MTQDLTKITTPLGLLDVETEEALKKAHRNSKVVQQFTEAGWVDHTTAYPPGWNDVLTYRIKPEPVVVSRWANVYDDDFGSMHNTREEADKSKEDDRICVLRIDWHDGVPSFHRE